MSVITVLPIFHRLNTEYFQGSLVKEGIPRVGIRWSDGRMKATAGLYRRKSNFFGIQVCEIILSKPLLSNLPEKALESTLCHEMIHAWIDLVLKAKEVHGPYFHQRMEEINSSQDKFQVTVRHSFPIPKRPPRWLATCPACHRSFPYQRLMKGAACRSCCNNYFQGKWNRKCLLQFERL